MGASESLFDGVSGLANHQTWMNVIGNNIANVNTAGFKDQDFNFADIISQTLRGASSAVAGGPGGTDANQVGLGVGSGSITTNEQQGSLQTTNLATDFAIQGDGLFIVSDGNATHYTRDGNFIVDGFGNINQASTGFHLQGYGLKQTGNTVAIDTTKIVNLTVPQQINPAQQTSVTDLIGNLQSSATVPQTQSVGVYDSLGQLHNVVLTFTPPASPNADWTVSATSADLAPGAAINVSGGNVNGTGALHFNQLGQLDGTITPMFLTFTDATNVNPANAAPPEPWLIPGTSTLTNAVQAAVQLNLSDPAVGSVTSFSSSTALQTQAVPNTAPLLGTQNNNRDTITGNLQSTAAAGAITTLTFTAADSNGYTHNFVIAETATSGQSWTATVASVDGAAVAAGPPTITITASGGGAATTTLAAGGSVTAGGLLTVNIGANYFGSLATNNPNDGNTAQTITLDLTKVTNTAINSGLIPQSTGSAGNSAGSLKDFNVDQTGVIHGVYTNGFTQTIGQILLANFENPAGLLKVGTDDVDVSANSGVVNVGTPGSGRFGTIAEGSIETSNVDLASEFSNMILAERGFQANSRIITTSDQMLQDVVSLKATP